MVDDQGLMILCGIAGILGLLLMISAFGPLVVAAMFIYLLHQRTQRGWIRRVFLLVIIATGAIGQYGWVRMMGIGTTEVRIVEVE